jgi:hypothetical protein
MKNPSRQNAALPKSICAANGLFKLFLVKNNLNRPFGLLADPICPLKCLAIQNLPGTCNTCLSSAAGDTWYRQASRPVQVLPH